jgi:hypothetical protein
VVLVATPFFAYDALPAQTLAGKVVIDTMNHYPARDGELDLAGLPDLQRADEPRAGARDARRDGLTPRLAGLRAGLTIRFPEAVNSPYVDLRGNEPDNLRGEGGVAA